MGSENSIPDKSNPSHLPSQVVCCPPIWRCGGGTNFEGSAPRQILVSVVACGSQLADAYARVFHSEPIFILNSVHERLADAIENWSINPPDVLLLDLVTHDLSKIEFFISCLKPFPHLRVLVSCECSVPSAVASTLASGAHAYIHKPASRWDFLAAVWIVFRRRLFLHEPQLSAAPPQEESTITVLTHSQPHETLSTNDRFLVALLGSREGNKSIALELGLSETCVAARLKRLYRKLGVRNRAQAVVICQTWGSCNPVKE
jgi:DNA-binding NarL/FixJ family response regulator